MVVLERPAIRPEPLSENARTTFGSASAPAWCLRLLHDANLTPVATPSRQPKASSEDSFIAETLATGDTISAWQSFYKVPQPQPRPSPATTGANSPVAGELVSLLALLGRGVNGHTNVAHGGLVATILDDTMGMVVGLHRSPGMSGYTASLNIKYRKPLRTPSIVLCRTWLESRRVEESCGLGGRLRTGKAACLPRLKASGLRCKKRSPSCDAIN